MGFFDFFRNKKEEKSQAEKLRFSELGSWLEEKKAQNITKEKQALLVIDNLISSTIEKLGEEKEILDKITLENKKADEKVKIIVLENRSNYSSYLEKLIDNLKNIKKDSIAELTGAVNRAFSEFSHKSALSFEKATFLIGKEIGDIKDTIGKFFRELNEILEDNKELIHFSRIISLVSKITEEIQEDERTKLDAGENIAKIEEEIKNLKERGKLIEKAISDIKNSKEHVKQEKEREEAKFRERELEKEIFKLKNMIDLKELAKIFHSNAKKMKIIRHYDENFNQIFESDAEEFIALLDEGKKQTVKEKIDEIRQKKEEIHKLLNKKDAKLEELASEIIGINSLIENFNSEKTREEKRIEKLKENIRQMKDSIKKELLALNIEAE